MPRSEAERVAKSANAHAMRRLAFTLGLFSLPAMTMVADAKALPSARKSTTLPDGLKYVDLALGKGAMPKSGDRVTVTYVGTLQNGSKFDASADHGGTFAFTLGQGQVIKGWDEGVATMRVGGRRRLIVPPELGYGAQGAGGVIPPNATLTFVIALLGIEHSP